jgi:uncharacterized phage-associated protein
VLRGAGLSEIEDLSDTEEWQALLEEAGAESTDPYDVRKLRAAVEGDRAVLTDLLGKVSDHLTSDRDPKLKALEAQLEAILNQAEREDVGDARDRRKVLIFTYFDDTAVWIYDYLESALASPRRLAPYRGRLAAVTGERALGGISRDHAIYGFAPKTTEAPAGRDDDLYDILVTTDILAEGMNLQQCRNIINYDLPWNPMRLVQRHGRIDRIGSPHDVIYLRCFFPDRLLDQLLDLEATSLVWTDRPLFAERIEAWANGPVVRELYARHRGEFLIAAWNGDASALTSTEKSTIDNVLAFYGDKSPQWLSDLTHMEAPWQLARARAGLAPGERGTAEITLEDMAEYYSSLVPATS